MSSTPPKALLRSMAGVPVSRREGPSICALRMFTPAAAEHGQVARRARVAQVVGAHHLRAFQHVVGGVGGAAHHQVVRPDRWA